METPPSYNEANKQNYNGQPQPYQYSQYNQYNQTSPLLGQASGTTTVIVTEDKRSFCCGCSLAVFVCVMICCCCVVSASILAGVFGYWGVQCSSSRDYTTSKNFSALFSGVNTRYIELETPGDIIFETSVLPPSSSIQAIANISATSEDYANEIRFNYEAGSSFFGLEAVNYWWICPLVDLKVTLSEFEAATSNLDLKLKSNGGDIKISPSILLRVDKADIETAYGEVRVKNLFSSGDLEVKTLSGNILVEEATGSETYLYTSNGKIEMKLLASNRGEIRTSNGDILGSYAILKQEGDGYCQCDLDMRTSNGNIDISPLQFPTSANCSCEAEIKTSTGSITVTVPSFSGEVNLSSGNGFIYLNGERYTGSVRQNFPGPNTHSLEIRTSNGDINFSTIL